MFLVFLTCQGRIDTSLICPFLAISPEISLTRVDFRSGGTMSLGARQNWVRILRYH